MMTEQEFAYLSDRIRGRLTALARRFNRASGCDADAEDIVQDALLTLWQLSKKGYPIRDEEALAVKITKTRCIERYRRQHIRFEPIEDLSIAGGVVHVGLDSFHVQLDNSPIFQFPARISEKRTVIYSQLTFVTNNVVKFARGKLVKPWLHPMSF